MYVFMYVSETLCPAKLCFKFEGNIKSFTGMQKLRK